MRYQERDESCYTRFKPAVQQLLNYAHQLESSEGNRGATKEKLLLEYRLKKHIEQSCIQLYGMFPAIEYLFEKHFMTLEVYKQFLLGYHQAIAAAGNKMQCFLQDPYSRIVANISEHLD